MKHTHLVRMRTDDRVHIKPVKRTSIQFLMVPLDVLADSFLTRTKCVWKKSHWTPRSFCPYLYTVRCLCSSLLLSSLSQYFIFLYFIFPFFKIYIFIFTFYNFADIYIAPNFGNWLIHVHTLKWWSITFKIPILVAIIPNSLTHTTQEIFAQANAQNIQFSNYLCQKMATKMQQMNTPMRNRKIAKIERWRKTNHENGVCVSHSL